jgi:hypothetical protein
VGADNLVPLGCRADTLAALSTGLTGFGPAAGAPDWLVSAIWLCTEDQTFVATATVEMLSDGYVARPLNLDRPADLTAQVDTDLPDIQGRLIARGSDLGLPGAGGMLTVPDDLVPWPAGPYAMSVMVRLAKRALVTSRIACALLFASEAGPALLVGTDVTSLAMVLSEDAGLIERYRQSCDELTLAEYRQLSGD